jgi:hypothetical protein
MMELGLQKIPNFMIDNISVVVYRLIATLAQIFFQVVKTKNVKLSTVLTGVYLNLVIRYQKDHLIHSKVPSLYAR